MGSNGSDAQVKTRETGIVAYETFVLDRKSLLKSRGLVPGQWWPVFLHQGVKVKAWAPAPALPLQGEEWKQWRSDLRGLKFDKLKDRQLLYAYYLSSPKAKKVEEVLKAVMTLAPVDKDGKDARLSMALGVEYDTEAMKLLHVPGLFRKAAVPFMWSKTSYEFIKDKHDPATFGALIQASALAFLPISYSNFAAVKGWSGLVKSEGTKMKALRTVGMSKEAVEAYQISIIKYHEAIMKGPLVWTTLKPVASFIAVDRKLDIEGVEPEAIVTSKVAWRTADG